jgi:methanethiol S-methyltransferase
MSNPNTVVGRGDSLSAVRDDVLIALTLVVGWVSLILFMFFVSGGRLNLVHPGLGETSALLLNTALSLVFFLQHSGMIRGSFRRWSSQLLGEKYCGISYTIASSILLILIVVFWQQSSYTLASAHGGLRWLLRGIFCVSLLGIFWGIISLGRIDAFGLDPIRNRVRPSTSAPNSLIVRGPYRWVRHPLYTFCLLMIWSCPDLTADRLLFNTLWTAWMVLGTVLEERDLAEQFGEEYRIYQSQVPMLFPNQIRPIR